MWHFDFGTELVEPPKTNFNRKSLGYSSNKLITDTITNRINDFNQLAFNGSSDTTYVTTIPPLKNREFTFTTWFNPSSTGFNTDDRLLDIRDSAWRKSIYITIQ